MAGEVAAPTSKLPAAPASNRSVLRKDKLRALVIPFPIEKAVGVEDGEDVSESKQVSESNPFQELVESRTVVEPPFDLFVLSTMPEMNTELGPCIDAMCKNIEGFGHRVVCHVDPEAEDAPKDAARAVRAERVRLTNFFLYAGMEDSFRMLRAKTRYDLETTGNGYWEVVRGVDRAVQYFVHMRSYQVRLTPQEARGYQYDMPIAELKPDGSYEIVKIKRRKRFRRYVQTAPAYRGSVSAVGWKTRWFKEFGDPREYDCETGRLIPADKLKDYPPERRANEVVHFKNYCTRSPYGLPRWIGAMLDMFGDRKASEVNYVTFCNNNVPSMLVAVSNGELTEDSVERINEFLERLQSSDNRSKVLVIEAEPTGEEGEQSGQVKIQVEELSKSQIRDALYQNYSKANREKVRVAFRLPPIFVGRSEDYTRATADTSRRLADEQVFAPERDEFDDWVNRILFPDMGILYHHYRSNSPNTTDNSELVSILSGAEKTGGMTPARADLILQDILGRDDLPPFAKDENFNPDLPFSLSMAEAVKNEADPTEPGQQVTAMKRLQRIANLTEGASGGAHVVQTLLKLRGELERAWDEEAQLVDEHEG
jgi:PBSX family phage portal protein